MQSSTEKVEVDFEKAYFLGSWLIVPTLNTLTFIEDKSIFDAESTSNEIRKVTPKVMALCVYLARAGGLPKSQNDIAEAIWPNRVISDSSIYQAIAQLRKALKHDSENIEYVERVSSKGYRLRTEAIVVVEQYAQYLPANKTSALYHWKEKSKKFYLPFLTMFFAIIAALLIYLYPNKSTTEPEFIETIAVLPTDNLTSPKVISFDGFSQLLLSELVSQSKVKFLYSRVKNNTFDAKRKLISSIQQDKDNLIASLQIVEQGSGNVLWAENYSAHRAKYLQLKNSAVNGVAKYLNSSSQAGTASINNIGKDEDLHFEDYALAKHLWDQRQETSLLKAQQLYEKILSQEEEHIGALVGLCHTFIYLSVYSQLSEASAYEQCLPLIAKAIELKPNNGEVAVTQAILLFDQGMFKQAGLLFEKATANAPNYAMGQLWYGNYLRKIGKYQQALERHKTAYSLDPLSPIIIRGLAYAYLNLRQVEKARKYYQRALIIEPHYEHRAVEELDFLPLNTLRAKAFLSWLNNQPANIANKPVYQLTQALVWLGMGNIEKAKGLITGINNKEINKAFMLYSQGALYSAQGSTSLALEKMTERLNLAPNVTRYVMPYISALIHHNQHFKALKEFRRYFPEIALGQNINNQNSSQFILLASLLNRVEEYALEHQIIDKLAYFIKVENGQLSKIDNIYWHALIEKHERVVELIIAEFKSGWLPDYNDNTYAESDLKALYLKSGGTITQWRELMRINRAAL